MMIPEEFKTFFSNMDQHHFSTFPMLMISSIIFMLVLLKLWLQKRNLSPKLPPGPRKLPFIGNLHQLLGDLPHRRLRDLASKHGALMHLQLGEVPFIIASSPETAEQIMKVHDQNFASRPNSLGAEILHYNRKAIVLAPNGNLLRNLRKICMVELLSVKRVQQFRSIREEEISNLVRAIDSSESNPINLSKMLYSSSYNIIIKALIGKKAKNGEKYIDITERAAKLSGGFNFVDVFPSRRLLGMMSGMKSKFKSLHEDADEILENILQEHKGERERCTGSAAMEDDLVHVLLNLQEQGKLDPPLTNDSIKGVIQDLIFGGIDTSSTTVEWAMSEMLKCPRVLQKAQSEVREVFGKEGKINELDFVKLKYIKLVIKEVLRLHPPLPLLIPREASRSCEINGYEIPGKAHIIVNAWAIGRDPRWCTQPESFNPERFIGSSIDFRGTDFGFLPFGAGRRMCPGISFGLANVEISLVHLLYHFDWQLSDGKAFEDLDMTENSGLSVRRKCDLIVVPYLHN